MIHENLRLYVSNEYFIIEPLHQNNAKLLSENLVINRDTGELKKNLSVSFKDPEQVMMIYGIFGFIRLFSGEYMIVISDRQKCGTLLGHEVYQMTGVLFFPLSRSMTHLSEEKRGEEEAYLEVLKSILNREFFYFSYTLDLTHLNAGLSLDFKTSLWQRFDQRFFYNRFASRKMIELTQKSPLDQDCTSFILPVLSGFFQMKSFKYQSRDFEFGILSKRQIDRMGTRFFSRGLDPNGNVSNFVETEHLFWYNKRLFIHQQIRGSIPLIWCQRVNVKYQPKLILNADQKETKEASFKHLNALCEKYGQILFISLTNGHGYESVLNGPLQESIQKFNEEMKKGNRIIYRHFDFHQECKKMRYERIQTALFDSYDEFLNQQSYSVFDFESRQFIKKQTSVVRSNCMDCLDRTNVVQSELSKRMLLKMMREAGFLSFKEQLEDLEEFTLFFRKIWADHADAISVMYSGTGALKTDFTRTGKRTKKGALMDGYNSCVRYVKNNFMDGKRQDGLDLLLGKYEIKQVTQVNSEQEKPMQYYLLPGLLVVSLFMLLVTCLFGKWQETKWWFWFIFWTGILTAAVHLIIKDGTEYVQMPKFIDPYYGMTVVKKGLEVPLNSIELKELDHPKQK